MTVPLRLVRTVHRLNDDEPPTEIVTVGGYRVERGIPIPPSNKGRLKGKLSRALDALSVGECLFNPGTGVVNARTLRLLKPKTFTQRKVQGGHRVWRMT